MGRILPSPLRQAQDRLQPSPTGRGGSVALRCLSIIPRPSLRGIGGYGLPSEREGLWDVLGLDYEDCVAGSFFAAVY